MFGDDVRDEITSNILRTSGYPDILNVALDVLSLGRDVGEHETSSDFRTGPLLGLATKMSLACGWESK